MLPQVQRASLAAESASLREQQVQLLEGQVAVREQQGRLAATERRFEGLARAQGIWSAATQVGHWVCKWRWGDHQGLWIADREKDTRQR